jgi:hypothetical protein
MGARTPWDMVVYLAGKSRQVSRSKYNMHRACINPVTAARGDDRLVAVIRSMPPYAELCPYSRSYTYAQNAEK